MHHDFGAELRGTISGACVWEQSRVLAWDPENAVDWAATPTLHRKFIWSGWLMLMELDGLDSDAVVRKYTWGLDLAGLNGQVNSLEMAGGIGGLLAVHHTQGTPAPGDDLDFVFTCDANGNVTEVLDWGANLEQFATVAHYEYDPYGNVINDLGGQVYAAENPWRFSTKPFDAETGLGYWGYRYYSPTLGRWMNAARRKQPR
jgi:RHS repeat-associated protein